MSHFLRYSLGITVLVFAMACAPKQNTSVIPAFTVDKNSTSIIGGTKVVAGSSVAVSTISLINVSEGSLCSASIIGTRWLVTAGHCVDGAEPADLLAGFALDLREVMRTPSESNTRLVESYQISSKYADTARILTELVAKAKAEGRPLKPEEVDAVKDWGDIAVVKLKADIPVSYRPAKLLPLDKVLAKDQVVHLAGYGRQTPPRNAVSGELMETDVKIENPLWGTTEVLVDQRQGHGACHGDSGGPAYVVENDEPFLFGVTSRGVGDGEVHCVNSAVYTNINAHRAWITTITGI